MTTTDDHARVTALGDQARASMRDHEVDIVRIAEYGPKPDGSDDRLIRCVMHTVAGDICMARANESQESQP